MDTIDDKAHHPQDEEDERSHYNNPGEELSLRDEPKHDDEEEERDASNGNPVRKVPNIARIVSPVALLNTPTVLKGEKKSIDAPERLTMERQLVVAAVRR